MSLPLDGKRWAWRCRPPCRATLGYVDLGSRALEPLPTTRVLLLQPSGLALLECPVCLKVREWAPQAVPRVTLVPAAQ